MGVSRTDNGQGCPLVELSPNDLCQHDEPTQTVRDGDFYARKGASTCYANLTRNGTLRTYTKNGNVVDVFINSNNVYVLTTILRT